MVSIDEVTKSPLVLVVGDVMNDVVVRPQQPFARDTDTRSEIAVTGGGSGANQAAWLGHLSGRARFAGRVGADDVSAQRRAFEQYGVDARLAGDEVLPTGTVVSLLGPDGEHSMFTDRAANAALSAENLDPSLLVDVTHLHVSGYTLFDDRSRAAVLALVAAAIATGIALSVDPASIAGLEEVGAPSFLQWTSDAELIFPNLDEGRFLSGLRAPSDVADALVEAYPVVALKLGRDGCIVAARGRGQPIRLPGAAEGVIDTTGAGDAFCAGFLAGWVRGADLFACAESAVRAATEAVHSMGARPSFGHND